MGEDGKRNVREKVYVCERSARVLNEGMDGEKQWHGIRRKRMYGDAYIHDTVRRCVCTYM